MSDYHSPVLLEQSLEGLAVNPQGTYVDVTFGGGGHSRAILQALGSEGRLLAFDRDADALANTIDDSRFTLIHEDFRYMKNFLRLNGVSRVDGILADLGVSSHQFDTEERGFSFRFDSELDMRMSDAAATTAREVVNEYSEDALEKILREYGEVANSRFAAKLICEARARGCVKTTGDLNAALEKATPAFGQHKYLAKVYQALRIEVNDEMKALERFMPMAVKSLAEGGILAVITYHSLEDRIVKNALRDAISEGVMEKVTAKPITPAEDEIAGNTRARSAKLRVARKIAMGHK